MNDLPTQRDTGAPDFKPVTKPASRMAFIDSMRLLAAVLVLLQHLFEQRPGLVQSWFIPLAPGVAGVAIFFFVSGYVIPMATRNGLDPREFMVRRVFRIFPLYLAALALMALAGSTYFLPRFAIVAEASFSVWMANILLVAEYVGLAPFIGVSWTLAVELVWYAMFAASFVVFGKRAADRLDIFMAVTLTAMTLVSLIIDVRIPLGRPTMIYAAVIGFQCYRFHTGAIDVRALARSLSVFACVALAGTYVAFGVFSHPNLTLFQAMGPWILGTVIFLAGVLYRPLREASVLNVGLLPVLGAMSYSIYLLHPIAAATANVYAAPALQVPVAIVLTFALSWLAFNFVEKPGIALGRAAAGRWTGSLGKARYT